MNAIAEPHSTTAFDTVGSASPVSFERSEHEPGPDRDEVEDADDVVGRRVVRALLVLVVEVIEARDRDPERERDDGGDDGAPVEPGAGQADDEEREREPHDVGDDEHAPNEPAAAASATGRDRSRLVGASVSEERYDSSPDATPRLPPSDPDSLLRSHHVKAWGFRLGRSRPDPKTVPDGLALSLRVASDRAIVVSERQLARAQLGGRAPDGAGATCCTPGSAR